MESYIIHPENKEQTDAIKAILKALKISFSKAKAPYNASWEAKMKKAEGDKKNGRYEAVKTSDLWK